MFRETHTEVFRDSNSSVKRMCLCGTAWCWVEMPLSYMWFKTCQPLIPLPHHLRKSRSLLRNTVQSHLGRSRLFSDSAFSLPHQSFSSGRSLTGMEVPSFLSSLLLGVYLSNLWLRVPRPLPHGCALQESSSKAAWVHVPWLCKCPLTHICHSFAYFILIAQAKCQISFFVCWFVFDVSIFTLLVPAPCEGHSCTVSQPFTAISVPPWASGHTVSREWHLDVLCWVLGGGQALISALSPFPKDLPSFKLGLPYSAGVRK